MQRGTNEVCPFSCLLLGTNGLAKAELFRAAKIFVEDLREADLLQQVKVGVKCISANEEAGVALTTLSDFESSALWFSCCNRQRSYVGGGPYESVFPQSPFSYPSSLSCLTFFP